MAISLINWPAHLPRQPLINGYEEGAAGMKIRTPMDSASAKQRNRFSTTAIPFTAPYLMDISQYATFKNFFNIDLRNGTLEFNLPIAGNDAVTQVVRFTEKNYEPLFLGTHWVVTCNLEVIP